MGYPRPVLITPHNCMLRMVNKIAASFHSCGGASSDRHSESSFRGRKCGDSLDASTTKQELRFVIVELAPCALTQRRGSSTQNRWAVPFASTKV
jgi:hypothetical protein